MDLFYPKGLKIESMGYADVGYLFDPHRAQSHRDYVFTWGNIAISWQSEQTITATSSKHSEILAIHEASCECIWLRV